MHDFKRINENQMSIYLDCDFFFEISLLLPKM